MKNNIRYFKFSFGLDVMTIKTDYFKIKFSFRGSEYDYKVIPTKQGNQLNMTDFKDIVNDFMEDKFWDRTCLNDVERDELCSSYVNDFILPFNRDEASLRDVIPMLHYVCLEELRNIGTDEILKYHNEYKKIKPKTIVNQYRERAEYYVTCVIKVYNKMEGLTNENQIKQK